VSSLSCRIAVRVVPVAIVLGTWGCGGGDGTTATTACGGMTPLEAARHYEEAARQAGASRRFIELVTEPTRAVEASPGYRRLVGAFYASTLPPDKRAAAAAACAKELAAE
jgi:hypothetical protein